MAIVKIAHHVKDGAEAVGDKVNVAIEDGKVVKVTTVETLSTHYKRLLARSRFGILRPLPWLSRWTPFFSRASSRLPILVLVRVSIRAPMPPPVGRRTARDSVDVPVLAPKDANALLRCDSSQSTPSLCLGPSPGRVALRRNCTRGGQRSGSNMPRRSSPDDGGSEGDGDSLVPIPFPRAVSGEYGSAPSSSPFNTPSIAVSLIRSSQARHV
ncbi:hypothetical protein EDB84DRAFT_1195630 [Lactarius hengduanensis]|nr:hypothetical protein EDB84DRAFT_1195630 [Lactarius hengduanensis]